MAGKKRKDPAESAADELLSEDTDVSVEETDEDDGQEPEARAEPIKDGDDVHVEPREHRRERRQNRLQERILSAVEERLGSRLASLEQAVRQPPQGAQPAPNGQPSKDELGEQIETRLQDTYKRQDQLSRTFAARQKAGDLSETEYQQMVSDGRKLNEEAAQLIAARTIRQLGVGRGPDPAQVQREAVAAMTRARHADVYSHSQADYMLQYADGHFHQAIARARAQGREVNMEELRDDAIDAAREQFGLTPRHRRHHRPGPAERARFTGAPTSGGTGSQGQKTVKVTKDIRTMADAAFPHIKDPNKRVEHWAATAGKRLVAGE